MNEIFRHIITITIVSAVIGFFTSFGVQSCVQSNRQDRTGTDESTELFEQLREEQFRSAETINRIERITSEAAGSIEELRLSVGRQHGLSGQLREEVKILEKHYNSILSELRGYRSTSSIPSIEEIK